MSDRLLVRGGTVVTAEGRARADVLIEAGRVAAVGGDLQPLAGDHVVAAQGCYVMPGLVDAHVHFALDTGIYRTDDDFGIGTRSAACGGVTTVVDFATQLAGQTPAEAVALRRAEADPLVHIDYALHCMVTDFPLGAEPSLADLVAAGAPSVKVYTTYRPNYFCDDARLLRIMRASAEAGALVMVHAENDPIVSEAGQALIDAGRTGLAYHGAARPPLAEAEAVHRCLFLAEQAGAALFVVHCSTPNAVRLIHAARAVGQPAIAETCPQYLVFADDVYAGPRAEWYIMQPPIRPDALRRELVELVGMGWVDSIGTDHCDYALSQKRATGQFPTTPGGIPGIETMLPILYTYMVLPGRLSLERLVQLTSTNPARIYGLHPRKGSLEVGADGDVVVYSPHGRQTIDAKAMHTVGGYTPYAGFEVEGSVKATVSRGHVVYLDGEFLGVPGRGRFVPGQPFDPAVIERL